MEKVEEHMNKIGLDYYYENTLVQKVSQKTNQKPSMVVLSFIVLMIIVLLTPLGSCIATLICFIIPAYETYKTIETEDFEQDQRLITYWFVFGFLYFFNQVLQWMLSIVPFYYLIRTAILIYVFVPEFKGAQKLYQNLIQRFFQTYNKTFEQLVAPFEHMGTNVKLVVQKNKEE